ncbi:MAG: Stk1 family PASTA domain-containing Ser/Thr kinase [Firmicutes bacterium]|nr:Stk1 family PASTA domain-containing Ser/Thr kinase [Bacillota bacterium]
MIGRILGNRYEIIEQLGVGGMALVYKARDTLLDRLVTIKILRDEFTSDDEFVKRFRREAQAVAKLSHPNVVSVYDVGSEGSIHYIVMEYIAGRTLKELIKEKAPLPPKQAVEIARQICEALEHAHENGIVHRDIKPHNILLTRDGRVKVTDFGIARAASAATVTQTGTIVGSVHYFSPEQAKGEVVGIKSDLYSVGAVLYEMMTGRVPFEGESPIAVALKHLQTPVLPPRQLNPSIPVNLEQVILKAMAKEPGIRFRTAREMSRALQDAMEGKSIPMIYTDDDAPTQVMPAIRFSTGDFDMNPEQPRKREKRKMRPIIKVFLVVAILGLLSGMVFGARHLLIVPTLEVPNVAGKTVNEAIATLAAVGLESRVVSSENNPTVPKDHVVRTEPPAGQVVKKNRVIGLVVSQGAKTETVPNVKGRTVAEASIILRNAGFDVGTVEPIYDAQAPKDLIVSQEPVADLPAPLGTKVKLLVSKGPPPQNVGMPNLIGLYLEEAKQKLEAAGLTLGVVNDRTSGEYFARQVIEQDTPPGTQIEQGMVVNLVVSKGPGPAPKTAPVSVIVPATGTEHQVIIVVEDLKGTREEYIRNHKPGDVVTENIRYYGRGKIRVLIDGQTVREKQVQ